MIVADFPTNLNAALKNDPGIETRVAVKEKLLNTFADSVSAKNYERLSYNDWKKIKHSPYEHLFITKDLCSDSISIRPYNICLNVVDETIFSITMSNTNTFYDFIIDFWDCFDLFFNNITLTSVADLKYNTINVKNLNTNTNSISIKKETNNMKKDFFNFDFGPVSNAKFRLSPYGIAVYTSTNDWVAYNNKTGEVFNVDILNFDASKLIYKIPVAQKDVKVGDILIHAKAPVFVRSLNENGTISVINYDNSTVVDILPVKSPFGFNFFTKVCPLIDFNSSNANPDNPFGNILPLIALCDEDNNFDPMMLFLYNNINNNMDFTKNPWMLYMITNKGKNEDSNFLPLLMMMNMNNGN